jgi:Domain of unknown function (DUF4277)
MARRASRRKSAGRERGNGGGSIDIEWARLLQPSTPSGAAIFCEQTGGALLGEGITADMLNCDCLGRTLDWLYEHDPTTFFAGLALQVRKRFEIRA